MDCNVIAKNLDTKIAEIHYYTSKFSILCGPCQEVSFNYLDFIQHYRDKHLVDIPVSSVKKELPLEDVGEEECYQWDTTMVVLEIEDPKSSSQDEEQEQIKDEDAFLDTKEEKLNKNSAISDTEDDVESEIDWSQAYSPNLLTRNQKRPYKPRNQPNRCSYCSKTFRRRYQLETHINIHLGFKPHQCEFCGRQFRAVNTLQRHLNTHRKREIFTCKYCSKEFSHRAAHVSHETRHTQERQVLCHECGKYFYTENQLDTHKRKMHRKQEQGDDDGDKLPYACDLCYKRYRSSSMLSTHKLKKHYRMAKHVCGQCGKKFVEEEQLKNHSNIHIIKDGI